MEDQILNVALTGGLGLGLVVGITAVVRESLKPDPRWLVAVAIAVAQAYSLGAFLAGKYPAFAEWWVAFVGGVLLALVAMGSWSGSKALAGK